MIPARFCAIAASVMLVALTAASPIHAQVSAAEREALIRFFQATGGDGWFDNRLWLEAPGTECEWYGVQCARLQTDNPFVLRLQLPDNNLTGRLPDSLAGLDGLITLVLSRNNLGGEISADLWGLSNLEALNLAGNQFTGTLPAAILAMPQGAPKTRVFLADNRLDGFEQNGLPDAPLGQEIELDVSSNRIGQLPPPVWRQTGAIEMLDLSDNRIEGVLALGAEAWPALKELDLSDNAITELTGLSDVTLPDLETLDLNRNRVGELPDSLPQLEKLSVLELGNNLLSGELPEWFAEMRLASLGLDNNALSGPVAQVFEAMDLANFPRPGPLGALGLRLHVANNRFSGPLPEIDYNAFNSPAQGQSPEFGLDLCFNDIELPDAATVEIIESIHRGLALTSCIRRDQAAMDPTVSGSWFNPARAGEGLSQMLLDDGRILTYWFTYTVAADDEPPGQMWLFDVTEPGPSWAEHRPLWITSGGRFGQGLGGGQAEPSNAWMRQNRIDADNQHFFYDYRGPGFCITGSCFWETLTERFDNARLTRLAGTRCDGFNGFEAFSGAWFDPARSGEGFVIEVLEDRRVVVYWFTYQPDGSGDQVWIMGDGEIFRPPAADPPPPGPRLVASATVRDLIQPRGGEFGPAFDPDDIEVVVWGDVQFHFFSDGSAEVGWDSRLAGFGSGRHPLVRLARPMLAECPAQ